MTQNDLGEAIGCTASRPQSTIYNYEAGIRNPGLHTCRLIVMALRKAGAKATIDAVFPMDLDKTA